MTEMSFIQRKESEQMKRYGPNVRALPGVFTPLADVLCIVCFNIGNESQPPSMPEYTHKPITQGDEIGHCNHCHRLVWVRADVAALQQVVDCIKVAFGSYEICALTQMGGGRVGIHIPLPSMSWRPKIKKYIMVTYDVDATYDNLLLVGMYEDREDECCIDITIMEQATPERIIGLLRVLFTI